MINVGDSIMVHHGQAGDDIDAARARLQASGFPLLRAKVVAIEGDELVVEMAGTRGRMKRPDLPTAPWAP